MALFNLSHGEVVSTITGKLINLVSFLLDKIILARRHEGVSQAAQVRKSFASSSTTLIALNRTLFSSSKQIFFHCLTLLTALSSLLLLLKHLHNHPKLRRYLILMMLDLSHLILKLQLIAHDKFDILSQITLRPSDIPHLLPNLRLKIHQFILHYLHDIFRSLNSAFPLSLGLILFQERNIEQVISLSAVMHSQHVEKQI